MALALQPSQTTLSTRPPTPGDQNQPAWVLHLDDLSGRDQSGPPLATSPLENRLKGRPVRNFPACRAQREARIPRSPGVEWRPGDEPGTPIRAFPDDRSSRRPGRPNSDRAFPSLSFRRRSTTTPGPSVRGSLRRAQRVAGHSGRIERPARRPLETRARAYRPSNLPAGSEAISTKPSSVPRRAAPWCQTPPVASMIVPRFSRATSMFPATFRAASVSRRTTPVTLPARSRVRIRIVGRPSLLIASLRSGADPSPETRRKRRSQRHESR